MKRNTIIEIIALLFVALFLYTGISKLMEYDVAKEQIALTPLLAPIADEIAIVLPIIEIIAAGILFIPRTRIYGLWVSLVLMTSFTGYVIYIMNYNAHIVNYNDQLPCTCSGTLERLPLPWHLVLNITLIILSGVAILLSRRVPNAFNEKMPRMAHT